MTIVATEDNRNAAWADSSSSFGRKMLEKMGWKGDGAGLGKNQQGTSTHLRAIRREDSLGIGAQTDKFGEQGWNETNKSFHGVLAALREEHGDGGSEGKKDKKKNKKSKKSKQLERKGSGLTLAANKVQAGHARKMREAKDLASKSAADMAAVFGVKVDSCSDKEAAAWPKLIVEGMKSAGDETESVSSGGIQPRAQEEGIGGWNSAAAATMDATVRIDTLDDNFSISEAERKKKKMLKKRKKDKSAGGDEKRGKERSEKRKRRRTEEDEVCKDTSGRLDSAEVKKKKKKKKKSRRE